ncbi:pyruvate formate lyase family protein [Gallintestinimicrobium sp.]|uniref:pyruvate formate lyase family protein n=1 Tax=Gallintestinimicrobium sp. TaxID=2981655 RepID=UPI00399A8375
MRLKPEGVSNAADAMAAIEKFVFEEEMVTLPQLVEILKNNWGGEKSGSADEDDK